MIRLPTSFIRGGEGVEGNIYYLPRIKGLSRPRLPPLFTHTFFQSSFLLFIRSKPSADLELVHITNVFILCLSLRISLVWIYCSSTCSWAMVYIIYITVHTVIDPLNCMIFFNIHNKTDYFWLHLSYCRLWVGQRTTTEPNLLFVCAITKRRCKPHEVYAPTVWAEVRFITKWKRNQRRDQTRWSTTTPHKTTYRSLSGRTCTTQHTVQKSLASCPYAILIHSSLLSLTKRDHEPKREIVRKVVAARRRPASPTTADRSSTAPREVKMVLFSSVRLV